jgi:hypothetical protein
MEEVKKLNEERERVKDIDVDAWMDIKSASESYSNDFDLELYCEELGKLRAVAWPVI